jgi:hypothetical protein
MGQDTVNVTDSETDRPIYRFVQSSAAAVIIVTNLVSAPLVSEPSPHGYTYERFRAADPLTSATTPVTLSQSLEPYASTTAAEALVPRWSRYVVQRLGEAGNGVFDFTGLLVPSRTVVERAWSVAQNYFRIDTPTPSVVPSEDGDICFVWHKAGWDLRIDVGPEETVVWAHHRGTGRQWFGSLEERRMQLARLLDVIGRR